MTLFSVSDISGIPILNVNSSGLINIDGYINLSGTTTDYYIGGSGGGGEATNELRIGSRTTSNTVALELFHAANPVSLGITYSGGAGLAFIESVHSSYDVNTHLLFKPGGTETWRIGSHGTASNSVFLIKPASNTYDFIVSDAGGTPIITADSGDKSVTFAGNIDAGAAGKLSFTGTSGSPDLIIKNNTATSNAAGTATLKFNQALTQAGGKIVSGRDSNYSDGATRDSHLKFYTATNASDTLALTLDSNNAATFAGKILAGTGASAAATINAYTTTVSTNLFSALRIIENSAASTYWDIGATGGASPDLKFFVNAGTTPKLTLSTSGNATFAGTIAASNFSGSSEGANTGDQTLPTASSLGAVTLTGTQTISGNKTFSSASNYHNGHLYYNSYDAAGNHYPHFLDGGDAGGTTVNFRQYYGTAYKTHTWTSDGSGNMVFTYSGNIYGSNLSGTNTGDQDLSSYLTASSTQSKYIRSDVDDTASGNYTFDDTSTTVKLKMTGHAGAASYNYFLNAHNDGGSKAVHFVNGSTRTADGGVDAYIIRNDGGKLVLGSSSHNTVLPSKVLLESGTGGTTSKLIFKTTDNSDESKWIRTNAYWVEHGGHANEGFKFIDTGSNILLQMNGGAQTGGNGALSATFAGSVIGDGGNIGMGKASSTPNISYGMFHYSGIGLGVYSGAGGGTQGIGFWLNNGTAAYEAGRWTQNGNFGIGDLAPTSISSNTASLSVGSSRTDLSGALINKANGTVKHQQYWDSSGYGFNLSANSGDFKWKVNNNNRMVVDKDGGLDIQGTVGQLFSVTNDLTGDLFSVSDISGIPIFNVNASGAVDVDGTLTSTGDVVAYSDERLKTNIETLDGSKVYDMRGVSFTKDNKKSSGVIAQELEKIAPELVNNDSQFKAVAYGNITGYLIEAIKELKSEIEQLKKQIK